MFEGLTGMDWIFLVAAVALGFGVVKFMLVSNRSSKSAVPSVLRGAKRQAGEATLSAEVAGMSGEKLSADGRREVSRNDDAHVVQVAEESQELLRGGVAWFEMLDVPRTASVAEIEEAFARKWSEFKPGRLTSLMTDLAFIADGGLEQSMPPKLEVDLTNLVAVASELKSLLGRVFQDMESARTEGLTRRYQGKLD